MFFDAPEVGIKSQQNGFTLFLSCLSCSSGDNDINASWIWTLEDICAYEIIKTQKNDIFANNCLKIFFVCSPVTQLEAKSSLGSNLFCPCHFQKPPSQ